MAGNLNLFPTLVLSLAHSMFLPILVQCAAAPAFNYSRSAHLHLTIFIEDKCIDGVQKKTLFKSNELSESPQNASEDVRAPEINL